MAELSWGSDCACGGHRRRIVRTFERFPAIVCSRGRGGRGCQSVTVPAGRLERCIRCGKEEYVSVPETPAEGVLT
jgi:hypothetical protein